MGWLGLSIVLSVVLTVVLNVAVRLFPNAGDRAVRGVTEHAPESKGRVFVPWKAMLVASILLTVAINLVIWIR